MSAAALVIIALVHTVAHVGWDLPHMVLAPLEKLNNATKCGICDNKTYCQVLLPRALESPPCPFTKAPTYEELMTSTTGLSGMLLWVVLLSMWAMSRASRRRTRTS